MLQISSGDEEDINMFLLIFVVLFVQYTTRWWVVSTTKLESYVGYSLWHFQEEAEEDDGEESTPKAGPGLLNKFGKNPAVKTDFLPDK